MSFEKLEKSGIDVFFWLVPCVSTKAAGRGRRTNLKRNIIKITACLFAALFCVSGYYILSWFLDGQESQAEFSQVEALLGTRTEGMSGISGSAEEEKEPEILSEYLPLYEANNDFVGWIQIEDTKINYPVMQSPDDPDFYLKHNFDKEYDVYGVPYMQAACDLLTSDNLIIHGHTMNNGSMFTNLKKYKKESFYREHKYIRFDTKYSYGTYEIVAAFATTANNGGYEYYSFIEAADEADFDAFIAACKELTPYEIEATAQYGDRLITLSTCEYTHKNGRMVVVAKKIA